jgi:hypothetical protein
VAMARALFVMVVVAAASVFAQATASAAAAPALPAVPPPSAMPAPAAVLVAGTPCSATARACADLSKSQAWLIRDGKIEYGPTRIVHGRQGYRTPAGTFRVFFKSRDHISSLYDVAMPNAVFFDGNIAFHQGRLRGGSHGCVRLSRAASQVFFGALQPGDVVQIVR